MKWLQSRVMWGSLLIIGGLAFLLQTLGIMEIGWLFWTAVFALVGVAFFVFFAQYREHWWAIVPGFVFLSISAITLMDQLFPRLTSGWGGAIVLGGIGLSFIVIYLFHRDNWWAIIPAGVLLSLAIVTGMEDALHIDGGGIFLLGLGITFALVALLPTPAGMMKWAWIPAGILGVMGALLIGSAAPLFNYLWPAGLILGGGYLILRAVRSSAR